MASKILQGNVFDTLPGIQPGSVDCCVTSPPYWMLRSYLPKGHPLKHLELGSEPTPAEYVANMVRVFGLVRECLADHGTLWVNVGDTYATGGGGDEQKSVKANGQKPINAKRASGLDHGNLCLIPWRLAIALQDDGWIVRSVVVWHKPAPMPCSVTGWRWVRCRVKVKPQQKGKQDSVQNGGPRTRDMSNGHYIGGAEWHDCPGCPKCEPNAGLVLRRGSWRPTSSWEPVLMLAKSPHYFCDGDAVKQPPAESTARRDQYTRIIDDPDEQFAVRHDHETICDGANLRDVWKIAAEPLREKHYAAYPTALVERCLRAGTSARGYCPECGKPWCRVVDVKAKPHPDQAAAGYRAEIDNKGGNQANGTAALAPEVNTVGWRPSCSCHEREPRPGLVLDPFAGSGRTGIAAQRLGLNFIGCELNPEYAAMAEEILYDANPLFDSK